MNHYLEMKNETAQSINKVQHLYEHVYHCGRNYVYIQQTGCQAVPKPTGCQAIPKPTLCQAVPKPRGCQAVPKPT